MTGTIAALVLMVVTTNPAGLMEGRDRTQLGRRVLGVALGLAVAVGLTAATEPILTQLSVSLPSFRTAAGILIGLSGAVWLVSPRSESTGTPAMLDGALTVFTPAVVAAAASITGTDGVVVNIGAAVAAVIVTLACSPMPDGVLRWLTRLIGGAGIVAGAMLAIDGVQTV